MVSVFIFIYLGNKRIKKTKSKSKTHRNCRSDRNSDLHYTCFIPTRKRKGIHYKNRLQIIISQATSDGVNLEVTSTPEEEAKPVPLTISI